MASRRSKPRQDERTDQRIRAAAAEIYRVVRVVDPDEITVLDEVQVREGLNLEHVERLAALLLAGGQYKDAIDLVDDGERLILADGWHRRAGYVIARERFVPTPDVPELKPLLAEIRPGGLVDALERAEEANLTHGEQLSMRGKKNVLRRRWERGHEWARLSNRALAALLGVSDMTVGRWRSELEAESRATNVAPERIGKDGKAYDVSGIQAANQRRAEEQAARTPQGDAQPMGAAEPLSDNGYQIAPEEPAGMWLDQRAVRGDNHNPVLDAAYRASADLSLRIMSADVAIRKVLDVRGIRALYALPADNMAQARGEMEGLSQLALRLAEYCAMQLERLDVMARTGRPYDEEGEA